MRGVSFSLLAIVGALPALANDSTAVQEAGGLRLVKDATVEILQEDLVISPCEPACKIDPCIGVIGVQK